MFTGRFYHNLDEKGRLTIPSGYREMLVASGGYITQGFDQNLMILLSPEFERIAERLRHLSLTDPEARLLKRIIFSGANLLEIDKAGRVLIPNYLRQYAQLDDELVIVGVGEYFEIWSAENWHSQDAQIQDAQENAQRFIAVDLTSI